MNTIPNVVPEINRANLEEIAHGETIIFHDLKPGTWERIIPCEDGIIVVHSKGKRVSQNGISEKLALNIAEAALPPSYKVHYRAFVQPGAPNRPPRLNGKEHLEIKFQYRQFEGHPFGAIFDTDEGLILMIGPYENE